VKVDVDRPAYVRQQRGDVQNGDAHGPESMRKKREDGGRCRAEQVDRKMAAVDRQEIRRHESVEQLVQPHHGRRDPRHNAFRTTAPPGGIAYGDRQKAEKQCDAHGPRLSWQCLPVNRRQPETAWTPVPIAAIDGHS
jgi:hypothetical protein